MYSGHLRRPRASILPPSARLLTLALLVLVAFAPPAPAGETWQIGDRTFHNVRVGEKTPTSVTIFHSGGITQLDLAQLPAELQQRFGYDPARADAWREEIRKGHAATRALEKRALELRRREAAEVERYATAQRHAVADTLDPATFEIRRTVDLRPVYRQYGIAFKNQGRRPSCSVFALLGALEYEYARAFGHAEPLSEEFLIWATLHQNPGTPVDDGFHFREVISALQTWGVARQELMPNTFGIKPSEIAPPDADARADALGRNQAIPVWYRTGDKYFVARVIDALNHATPVVVGIRWPHPNTLRNNHLLRDQRPLSHSAHAVTIIGYESPEGTIDGTTFIFRNSYGTQWGLGGCGLIAARYLHENAIAAFHLVLPGTRAPRPETKQHAPATADDSVADTHR